MCLFFEAEQGDWSLVSKKLPFFSYLTSLGIHLVQVKRMLVFTAHLTRRASGFAEALTVIRSDSNREGLALVGLFPSPTPW